MGIRDNQFFTIFVPALRELRRSRRPPGVEHSVFRISSTDGIELFCTRMGANPDSAVIVAHAAIGKSYQRWIVDLAEELSRSFTVFLFDFRGHGLSTGKCPIGFVKPSEDLESVAYAVRGMGFARLGVAGFSMGAAAAFLLASRRNIIDALVSIGCPPNFPEVGPWSRRPRLIKLALRVMGTRAEMKTDLGATPIAVAPHLPPMPKLLIFGEREVAPSEEVQRFIDEVSPPKESLIVPGVWHADLGGREKMVREWFERML